MMLHNLKAEQAVLGSCIISPEALNKTYELIHPDDFYSTNHQMIYNAIVELTKQNIAVDLITLSDILKNQGKLETIGGYSELTNLMDTVPVAGNVEYYNNILKKNSKQRKIYTILGTLKEGKIDIDKALNDIGQLPDVEVSEESLKTLLKNSILTSAKGTAHKFKIPDMNHFLGGVDKGELITIGGYTSSGKTSLALSLAIDFAEDLKKVLFLTSEMTVYETARRILANLLPKNILDIRKGNLSTAEINALQDIAENAGDKWKFNIRKVSETEEISRYIRKYEPEIVFVDYLQNLDRHGARSDYEKVTRNIKDLQGITLKNEITTFVLSQLSRNKETVREPKLTDLRDSGRIEEVSNIVLFVYWEARLKEKVNIRQGGEDPEKIKIKLSKNRDGSIGNINADFYPEYCKVESEY